MFKSIRQGQAAAIWSVDGSCRIVHGPRRVWLFRKRLEQLRHWTADQNHYLAIKYRDGRLVNHPGPIEVFQDPTIHESIVVKEAISLTAHEVLVVYRPSPLPDEKGRGYTAKVDRALIRGPLMYVPNAEEWLHEFVWHGTDRENKTRKIPKGLTFTKLRTVADQFYYNVGDVRTSDDALITVKVMVFFELLNIELMLDTTHDPIADFINSVTADVIAFTAVRPYETFLSQTGLLNSMESYPQLVQRAERMGYHVSKVVYRGYHASDKLQAMMDSAIEARTSLRLEHDTEEQAQQLADMKLQKEIERADKRRDMERQQKEHDLAMSKAESEAILAQKQAADQQQLDYLRGLKAQDIDLTKYLVAQYQNPDKLIKIDTGANSPAPPAVHLHQLT